MNRAPFLLSSNGFTQADNVIPLVKLLNPSGSVMQALFRLKNTVVRVFVQTGGSAVLTCKEKAPQLGVEPAYLNSMVETPSVKAGDSK